MKREEKKRLKIEKKVQKLRAKSTDIKVITYELKGLLTKRYEYQGTDMEKHMAQMLSKGYAIQAQIGGGGEVRLFKTYVKAQIFGALGLLGSNRNPKTITVTYIKEPDF